MKIKQKPANPNTYLYKCKECGAIIEIEDNEFALKEDFPPFPHLMGLNDFKKYTMIKTRVCTCPVCKGTIVKERDLYKKGIIKL